MSPEETIFRRGSTTYYFSSLAFPASVRMDVLRLYSFVRVADDYVDSMPARPEKLRQLIDAWRGSVPTDVLDATGQRVVRNMRLVAQKYDFEPEWTEDFLAAMQADSHYQHYETLPDSLQYVHGSAEVIGLMMMRIVGAPRHAEQAAISLGRAMQWINFIRDIAEDNQLGRCYFPQADLRKFGLLDLRESTARANPEAFTDFIRFQLQHYAEWQAAALPGFTAIPRSSRIPVRTASDMYDWTARRIAKNPFVVFDRTIKPSKLRVLSRALWRVIRG